MIGGGLTLGLFYLAELMPITDNITTFSFKYAFPNLFSALLVFGFVPVFCKYIGLVKKVNEHEISDDDIKRPLL